MDPVRKCKEDYIDNIEEGMLVAFLNDGKMLAAKVKDVGIDGKGKVTEMKVATKNGSIYHVKREDVAWVKTGSRWPAGIYNALKEVKESR